MTTAADAATIYARSGTKDPTKLPHTHTCGTRWAGANTSHCGACCLTFSGVGPFDRHRRDGRCLNPADLGMSLLAGRAYEVWGYPADPAQED